ncbi:hypothetical protein GGE08_003124 [Muricauda sp. ARW1Y1]|nr:hypothetical protein [Muricauda sp. ARW1Y1]
MDWEGIWTFQSGLNKSLCQKTTGLINKSGLTLNSQQSSISGKNRCFLLSINFDSVLFQNKSPSK